MNISIVYIPTPSEEVASSLVNLLLEKKLIACANIVPSNSAYVWQGEYTNEAEFIIFAKTKQDLVESIIEAVEANHPYDLPAILHWDVKCNRKYYDWVMEMVG